VTEQEIEKFKINLTSVCRKQTLATMQALAPFIFEAKRALAVLSQEALAMIKSDNAGAEQVIA
jgi:hypothetical protein